MPIFLDEVRVAAPAGDDFDADARAILETRGTKRARAALITRDGILRVCDLRATTRPPDLRARRITTARSASHEQVR